MVLNLEYITTTTTTIKVMQTQLLSLWQISVVSLVLFVQNKC